jgi:transposase
MWSPSGKEGKTYRQIARETGVSPAQAQRIYEQWNINRKIHNAQRTGRPRKLSARDLRQAKRVVGKMPFATLDKVAEECHAPVKPRVLGRYLRNEGWYCRRARKKTWLDPTTRRKRYRWCLLRKKWDVMQWKKVVYCDEKILGPGHSGKSKYDDPPVSQPPFRLDICRQHFPPGAHFVAFLPPHTNLAVRTHSILVHPATAIITLRVTRAAPALPGVSCI